MNTQSSMQAKQSNDIHEVRGLSSKAYVDQTIFEAEKKTIFWKRWCSIDFETSIPNSGDLKPIEFLGQPLLIARTFDGEVKVFHNACPHRGTQLISENCNKKLIVCPYHSWSFELNGKLRKAPHYEQADPATFSLKPVRTHVWAGTIFVNLSGNAEPFSTVLEPLTNRWYGHDFSLLQPGGALTYDFVSNWKLIAENFLECYHVPSVHPKLAQYSKFSDRYPINFDEEYIGQGSHRYRPSVTTKELPRWPNVSPEQEFQAEYVVIFPNTLIGRMPDHVFVWSLEPLSPKHTIEHLRFFFIGKAVMGEDFEEDRAACLKRWAEVNNEDHDIIQRLYQGHKSSSFLGAKFVPGHEETIYAFQKLVKRSLEDENV